MLGLAAGWDRLERFLDVAFGSVTVACVIGVATFAFRCRATNPRRNLRDGGGLPADRNDVRRALYYLLLIWNPDALKLLAPVATLDPTNCAASSFYSA